MRINEEELKKVEQEKEVVSLLNLRKEKQYLYVKVRRDYSDKIVSISLPTKKGEVKMDFIPKDLLEKLESRKSAAKKEVIKRAFVGRPPKFCLGCQNKDNCTLNVPCEKRDEHLTKKSLIIAFSDDDRFHKNGVPKKRLVLCQSSKYLYAHKRPKGECQKEKCSFYSFGICMLELDKK